MTEKECEHEWDDSEDIDSFTDLEDLNPRFVQIKVRCCKCGDIMMAIDPDGKWAARAELERKKRGRRGWNELVWQSWRTIAWKRFISQQRWCVARLSSQLCTLFWVPKILGPKIRCTRGLIRCRPTCAPYYGPKISCTNGLTNN